MHHIDLTHTLGPDMPVYPGDPHPELRQIADIQKDGFTDHELRTTMHVGTHMDAPLHMIEGGKRISEIDPERFIGRGRLIDARGVGGISVSLLEQVEIESGDIVLLLTGFSEKFGETEYFENYPEMMEEFARKVCETGVKIVGMDTPSPDRPPFAIHKLLLSSDVLIIENLTNLEALLGIPEFVVTALPAKFHADAAPVRVVATAA